MKILYINTYIPFPLNNGGNQAFFMMADYARKQHELSILLYIHNAHERQSVEELKALWPDVTFYLFEHKDEERINKEIQATPYESMPWLERKICTLLNYLHDTTQRKLNRRKWHHALRQLSREATENNAATSHTDFVRANSTLYQRTEDLTPAFCEYVKKISAQDFDVVQVEFYEYLPLVYLLPEKCKKVFVHHELRFVRNENELQFFQHPLATDRLLIEREKAQELTALNAYDAVITLTDIDHNILAHYLPAEKIFTSPAITYAVGQEKMTFRAARELLFVGSGYHFPNTDAMIWFSRQIIPILRERLGEIPTIHITGKWRREVQKYITHLCPEAVFDGFIDDLPAFINGKISIVPLRIGSGMRMKILDAISAGAPLITTSKGCEGLPLSHQQECLIADTPDAFADSICSLLAHPELQQSLVDKAQNADTSMLKESELLQKRLAVYESICHHTHL